MKLTNHRPDFLQELQKYNSDKYSMYSSVRTMILHKRLHFLLDALVPLGDVDVQRVVAARLTVGPFPPLLEGRQEADSRLR